MTEMEAAAANESAETESQHEDKEEYLSKDLYFRVKQLEKEKAELQQRLDFVEALVGPTEAQRKLMQEKLLAARTAALQAKWRGACLPTKVAGRVDEMLLFSRGLSDTDAGLLQGGCLPNSEGILQDVSMLGDPGFHPYSSQTGEPKWQARGGLLRLSLEEIGHRFGEEIAQDVVRCAKELDKYDASRRVGVELPWHPMEDRELEPAEVINLMDRELALAANLSYRYPDEPLEQLTDLAFGDGPATASPYAVHGPGVGSGVGHARRAGPASRAKRSRGRAQSRRSAGSAAAVYAPGDRSVRSRRVVPLPRLEANRRNGGGASRGASRARSDMNCLPDLVPSMQELLQHPLLGCIW